MSLGPVENRNGESLKCGINKNYAVSQGAVIENKNVNIIVNVDPKDVAKELWKLIQNRMDDRQGRRSADDQRIVEELEKIVTPIVRPTRRSHKPTAFELAYSLDHLTRKALIGDHMQRPTIEDEIVTRDVVARMMMKLKTITKEEEESLDLRGPANTRRMQVSEEDERKNDYDGDDDEFVNVNLKIRKSELLKATGQLSTDDS